MADTENVRLLRLFRQAAHRLDNTRKYRGQGWLLILLYENGSMTQRELIEITERRSSTLSEQLFHMEQAGWLRRCKNAEDQRNIDVTLTPLGKQKAEEVLQAPEQLADLLFDSLDREEKAQLTGLMEKLMPQWKTDLHSRQKEV